MTAERSATAFVAIGAFCFIVAAASVVLRVLGIDVVAQEQTTSLAAGGLMAVAVGVALRRRA